MQGVNPSRVRVRVSPLVPTGLPVATAYPNFKVDDVKLSSQYIVVPLVTTTIKITPYGIQKPDKVGAMPR